MPTTLTYGNRMNLFHIHKAKTDSGETVEMALNLAETNDMIRDFPSLSANQGFTHKGIRWTTLPSGQIAQIGGTWGTEMGDYESFVEGMVLIRSTLETPTDVIKSDDPAQAAMVLQGFIDAHEQGMGQGWANLLLKGDSTPRQDSIVGLMQRAPWKAIDNEYCFGAGGTGNDLRSGWLMCPGVTTVHFIYNRNHPTMGVEVEKKAEVYKVDSSDATKHNYVMPVEFSFEQGICIRDQKAVKRIANIPCGYADDPDYNLLFKALLSARHFHTVQNKQSGYTIGNSGQWFFYCDGFLYAKLVCMAEQKLKVFNSANNVYQTELPMIGDIVIRRMDALNYAVGSGESVVS